MVHRMVNFEISWDSHCHDGRPAAFHMFSHSKNAANGFQYFPWEWLTFCKENTYLLLMYVTPASICQPCSIKMDDGVFVDLLHWGNTQDLHICWVSQYGNCAYVLQGCFGLMEMYYGNIVTDYAQAKSFLST